MKKAYGVLKKSSKAGQVQMSKSLPAPRLRQAGKCQMNVKMNQCQTIFLFYRILLFELWISFELLALTFGIALSHLLRI
jgi:hypothetical protein